MPESNTSNESIRIYKVLDPSALLEARDRLVAMFAGRSEDDDIIFKVSEDGGRIWFADNAVMWQTKDAASLPRNRSEAEIQARAFIGRVNTAIQNDRNLAEVGISRIFPDDIRASSVAIVNDPARRVPDHWIVRFDVYLPTGTEIGSVPVYGAATDMRVGPGGRIAGCWISWRPCIPEGVTALLAPALTLASQDNPSEAPQPILLYVLADEGVKQLYIAPYYFVGVEDHGEILPASLFSPIAKIVNNARSDAPAVAASVLGGSEQYAFRWAAWDLTNPQNGVTELGSDDQIELQPGCYNVILQVTDTVTDVVVYTEGSIYTEMFTPDSIVHEQHLH